jgi:predicted permease
MDVRFAIRMLLKTPAVTAVAVLSLALGIGANTAIFSLIDAVLLKMLPVENPRQLVVLTDPVARGVSIGMSGGVRGNLSNREYEGLRDRTQSFIGLFAAQSAMDTGAADIEGQPPLEIKSRLVSANYFTVLGARAIAGRTFSGADDRGPGAVPYAVASYSFWKRQFGGSPSVFDKTIRVRNASLRVIGVAEPRFHGESVGDEPDLWIPLAEQPLIMPGRMWLEDDPAHPFEKVMWLHAIGRLKPGVTIRQAQANVNVVFKQIVEEEFGKLPQNQRKDAMNQSLQLHPGAGGVSSLRGDFAEPLYVLMAIVGLVLLIACANVANLLLARATARQKEIGIRLALGANRGRVVRQFLTESFALSLAGGLAGVFFAIWGVHLLLRMVQSGSDPVALDVAPDLRVLLFTIGISVLTGVVFGLAPAWRSVRVNVSHTLKEAGRGMTGSSAKIGLGKSLVIAQIALSVLLLIGAGWFVRTLRNLGNVDLGYARDKLVLAEITPLTAGYQGARLASLYRELHARFQRIPGVRSVAYSQNGLFSGSESGDRIDVEGYKPAKGDDGSARFDEIGPNYFSAIGIPVILGREIGPQDNETAPRVCVVNQAFAKFFFGHASPVGRHVTDLFPGAHATMEIVGVVGDVRDHNLRGEISRRFYLPVFRPMGDQIPPFMNYEIRTSGEPAGTLQAARAIIRQIDPAIPVTSARSLIELVDRRLTQEKLIAQLSAAFGALALLLACIGLYGVLSYSVALRTNEIGIRMALGAERGRVILMVLRETSLLLLIGLAIGVPATLACARFVQSKLYGLEAADPLTLGAAIGIMAIVAIVSGYLPARRASKVDPLEALRYE